MIAVELNYRLGVSGFAQSTALNDEKSGNAGLRDQRLAIEWVQSNIADFGGDASKITIHGQSSGGLAVGMQILAYGGTQPYPFQQGVCESQALEPGITGNFTRQAMAAVINAAKCETPLDSPTTINCLRELSMHELLKAQLSTASVLPNANLGDQWLPAVDGDFLPAAPSQLIKEGRYGSIDTMMGWCENDGQLFVPRALNASETFGFFSLYLPAMTTQHLEQLLALYRTSDFSASHWPNGSVILPAESYRAGRILRDILFTCQPVLFGQSLQSAGSDVYFYLQNQTILTPLLNLEGVYGNGVIHGSELPYVFGNSSHLAAIGVPSHPLPSDYVLRTQESRSWSSFAALGQPSLPWHDTLAGWREADFRDENYGTYAIGGPNAGYSGPSGSSSAREAVAREKLMERCSFLNSPDIIKEVQY